MKKNISIIILFLSIILFNDKNLLAQENFKEQKAGNTIFLQLPNYLVKTNTLNDDAILQYLNSAKEAYVIVIDDSKKHLEELGSKYENVSDFHENISKSLIESLKEPQESKKNTFTIGENKYSQSTLKGTFTNSDQKEVGITYLLTYIETTENYYQILCWSTTALYPKLEADYLKITKTFREGNCN